MANLVFNYSAMNGGKTINILQTAHSYEEKNLKVILIKSITDTKGEDKVVSRIGMGRKCDILIGIDESLLQRKYYNMYYNSSLILIDEVEMLSKDQVEELWTIAHLINVPVIAYGLKGNFKKEIFSESIAHLFAVADISKEIGNTCLCECGKTATHNSRKVNGKFTTDGEVVVIDGSTSNVEYVSLCGDCYMKYLSIFNENSIKLSKLVENKE